MPIQFQCPACNRRLQVGSKKASQSVECPQCAEDVVVPSLAEAAAVSAMVASINVEPAENGLPDFSSVSEFDLDHRPSGSAAQSETSIPDAQQDDGALATHGRFSMSRGAIYALVLLLLVAVLIGFGAGLLVGKSLGSGSRSQVSGSMSTAGVFCRTGGLG